MYYFSNVYKLFFFLLLTVQGIPDLAFFNANKLRLQQTQVILRNRPKNSQVDPRYYTTQRSISYKYKQILNQPTLCSQHERVFLLYAIRTFYKQFDRRQVLRDIMNQPYVSNPNLIIKHIFLFGRVADKKIEETIQRESEQYKDIIQEDFVESYINVSYKAIMAWKWSVEFCPNVHYVFVMNDELFVDQNKVVNFLLKDMSRGSNKVDFSLCYFKPKEIPTDFARNRKLNQKYMYQGKYYPEHCHGAGYIAHIEVINRLYKASLTNPPMMPTDVWIGILAEKLNLKMANQRGLYVIKNIKGYFENPKYLSQAGMVAITDEEVQKPLVGKIQRHLFNTVQRQWKKKTSSLFSPSPPPPIHSLPHLRETLHHGVLVHAFPQYISLKWVLIIIPLILIVLLKRNCLTIINSRFRKRRAFI